MAEGEQSESVPEALAASPQGRSALCGSAIAPGSVVTPESAREPCSSLRRDSERSVRDSLVEKRISTCLRELIAHQKLGFEGDPVTACSCDPSDGSGR